MIKLRSLREVALEYSEEDSSNNFKERIWRLTSPIVSFSKIGSFSVNNNNAVLLPSHDVLFNMAINYLEIWEIFRFAKCCKLIFSSLFNDKSLKSIEQTDNEFNDCLFNIWRKTKSIPDKQMIHDLVKKYNKKALDLMLEMRPLPFDPKYESSIAEEVFEALKSYGMTLEETDKECQQFHWKFTEFFVNYCSHGEFKDSYLVQLMFRYLSMKYQPGVTAMIQAIQYADKRIQNATSSKIKK